ncbi:MAG: DUF4097 family beta strand repeat-containing protein [Gemmatimonadaceae bacterium]
MRSTLTRSTFAATALLLLALAPALPAGAQAKPTPADARARERERAREHERRMRDEDDDEDDDMDDDMDVDEDDARGVRERTVLDTTIAFGRGGVVDLSLTSGDIRVVGWARSQVRVQARAEEGGEIRFESSSSRLSLDVVRQGGRQGGRHGGEAHYELSVPEGTRVLMRSQSGDLAVRAVKGEVEARTISGDVSVEDAARRIEIESVSGDVRAARLAGDVRAHSVSGEVELADVDGDVDVEAVSGDISVRGARAKVTRAETVSGDVTYTGTVDPAGRYDFHSHSGTVRLVLPAGTNAALSVETFSGEIDSAFPLTLRPESASEGGHRRPRRMEFTLGAGGPRINAETFSGDVVIERASR